MDLERLQRGGGGVGAGIVRALLLPASWGWGAAWRLKRAAYRSGLRRCARLGVPVLSVGNLVAGGTGKTPLTAWLVASLRARGRRPAVLARGYGPRAAASDLSDEGALLRHLLGPDVPIVEAPDRHAAGEALLARRPDVDVVVLDDAFQHWRLHRDLDVVLLDATRPFGHGHLLPRGLLREPPVALARSGAVVLTRTEQVGEADLEALEGRVRALTQAPIARAVTRPVALEAGGRRLPPGALAGEAVHVLCGIGNPAAFVRTAQALGARVVGRTFLRDHAPLGTREVEASGREAARAGARWLLLTRKDAVKLAGLPPQVAVLDVTTEIVSGAGPLEAAIDRALADDPPPTPSRRA